MAAKFWQMIGTSDIFRSGQTSGFALISRTLGRCGRLNPPRLRVVPFRSKGPIFMRYEQWRSLTKWAFLALFPVLAASGCGTAKVNISGKVSYKGAPLKGGNVTFSSTAGKGDVSSRIAEDGTYTLERCPTGPV